LKDAHTRPRNGSKPGCSEPVRSTRPELCGPYPINAIGDRHLGVPIAEIAAEQAGFVLPTDTITDPPLGRYAGGRAFRSPNAALAGLAGFSGW